MLCGVGSEVHAALLKKCMFVTSYDHGYAWQNGVERGLHKVLEGKCEIRQFDMDSKRNPEPAYCQKKALEAKTLIESWQPDIIIAADDNVSKYLIAPYFKDTDIPIVFFGLNWTAAEYGYPFSNATGMIEVFPLRAMHSYIREIIPNARSAICLIPDRLSANKSGQRTKEYLSSVGIRLDVETVATMADFKRKFIAAQQADFIILFNNAGILDWDDTQAMQIITQHADKLTVTLLEWMTPFVMLGLTTVPEEQGEYAANAALSILAGMQPGDIPVVTNRQWNTYVNESLLQKAGITLPKYIIQLAEKAKLGRLSIER